MYRLTERLAARTRAEEEDELNGLPTRKQDRRKRQESKLIKKKALLETGVSYSQKVLNAKVSPGISCANLNVTPSPDLVNQVLPPELEDSIDRLDRLRDNAVNSGAKRKENEEMTSDDDARNQLDEISSDDEPIILTKEEEEKISKGSLMNKREGETEENEEREKEEEDGAVTESEAMMRKKNIVTEEELDVLLKNSRYPKAPRSLIQESSDGEKLHLDVCVTETNDWQSMIDETKGESDLTRRALTKSTKNKELLVSKPILIGTHVNRDGEKGEKDILFVKIDGYLFQYLDAHANFDFSNLSMHVHAHKCRMCHRLFAHAHGQLDGESPIYYQCLDCERSGKLVEIDQSRGSPFGKYRPNPEWLEELSWHSLPRQHWTEFTVTVPLLMPNYCKIIHWEYIMPGQQIELANTLNWT
jgi:hypothetical protein